MLLLKTVGIIFLMVTGGYAFIRFCFMIAEYNKNTIFNFYYVSLRFFQAFTIIIYIFGMYDIWMHSLNSIGPVTTLYVDIFGVSLFSFWVGFLVNEVALRVGYSKKRKFFDILSLVCFLLAALLVNFVQG